MKSADAVQYILELVLIEPKRKEGFLGLLIPCPLSIGHQRFIGFANPEVEASDRFVCRLTGQRAHLWRMDPEGVDAPIGMTFEDQPDSRINAAVFEPIQNRYTTWDEDFARELLRLVGNHKGSSGLERTIVQHIANKFDYGKGNCDLDRPKLLRERINGDCVNINTHVLAALYVAQIRSAYLAGYFFESRDEQIKGTHCWIATSIEKDLTFWDVAQQLKDGRRRIKSGLNPLGGLRFAITYGRGLVFEIGEHPTSIGYFAAPRWVYEDGDSSRVLFRATARVVA